MCVVCACSVCGVCVCVHSECLHVDMRDVLCMVCAYVLVFGWKWEGISSQYQ